MIFFCLRKHLKYRDFDIPLTKFKIFNVLIFQAKSPTEIHCSVEKAFKIS